MEDASLLSAVSEVLSLYYLFSVFGLAGIIAKIETPEGETAKEDSAVDTAKEDFAVEMVKVLKDVTAAKVAREEMPEAVGMVEEVSEVEQKERNGNKN